jgi:hypothetical protein
MPYIPVERREEIMEGSKVNTPGELTWVLTAAINLYLKDRTLHKDDNTFVDYADVLAALEATKLEFYRRIVAPYEEQKCFDNGDVYE